MKLNDKVKLMSKFVSDDRIVDYLMLKMDVQDFKYKVKEKLRKNKKIY